MSYYNAKIHLYIALALGLFLQGAPSHAITTRSIKQAIKSTFFGLSGLTAATINYNAIEHPLDIGSRAFGAVGLLTMYNAVEDLAAKRDNANTHSDNASSEKAIIERIAGSIALIGIVNNLYNLVLLYPKCVTIFQLPRTPTLSIYVMYMVTTIARHLALATSLTICAGKLFYDSTQHHNNKLNPQR